MYLRKLYSSFLVCILLAGIFVIAGSTNSQGISTYILGPEDVVTINLVNHPEFSGDFLIPSDGMLNLPGAGKIAAGGKSIDELTALVKEGFSQRFIKPDVTVSLKVPGIHRIYVIGAVEKAGAYDLKPGWRITEAISAASGLASNVNKEDCKVIILRASSGAKETYSLADALRGVPEANVSVFVGDVITVDSGDTVPVYITGKVKNPGLIRIFKDNANVMNAIAMAGGLLPESATDSIKISRLDGTSQVINITSAVLGGKETPNTTLQSGDMINIPESTMKIVVLGFVGQPGIFPIRDGVDVTLSDALGMAKGFDNKRGGLSSIAVVRMVNGKEDRKTYNLKRYLKNGDVTQNPLINPGDVIYVPETGKLDWNMITQSISVLAYVSNAFNK